MNTFGYDYGIKPIVMVVGDTEFPNFLVSKEFVALVYDQISEFGLLVDPPRLTMVFSNIEVGRSCFTHFRNWSGDSEDGDAVRISFVEFKDGSYGMCISQDVDGLINRMVPKFLHDEVELRIMNVGHIRTFPHQSEGYKWFKSAAQISPFVLAFQETSGAPIRELAIRKREICYYQEDNLPEHSIENSLVRSKDSKEEDEILREIPPEIRFGQEGIYERRRKQMSKFFPVTLERLNFNKSFFQMKEQLLDTYQEWQIMQAACNIALKHSASELFTTAYDRFDEDQGDSISLDVLEFLLTHHEDLARILPPDEQLSFENLRAQIHADAYELLKCVTQSDCKGIEPSELQSELEKHGLLAK